MYALLVKDEPRTAAFLRRGLEENDFTVVLASQRDEGLTLARTESFSTIMLVSLAACDAVMGQVKDLSSGLTIVL